MGFLKKNDKSIKKEYSEINDIDELIKKLADECANIARKNVIKDILVSNTDDLMEIEIDKFSNRLKEIYNKDNNIFIKWFDLWKK